MEFETILQPNHKAIRKIPLSIDFLTTQTLLNVDTFSPSRAADAFTTVVTGHAPRFLRRNALLPTDLLHQGSVQCMAGVFLLRRKGPKTHAKSSPQLIRKLFQHREGREPSSRDRQYMDSHMLKQVPAQRIAFDSLGVRMI